MRMSLLRVSAALVVSLVGAGSPAFAQPAAAPALTAADLDAATVAAQLKRYLFDAARRGDEAVLREFVAARYDLNARDEKGYTALILAAYHGHAGATRLLLDAGADPCAKDVRGNTALMGAIFKGELAISRMLMQASCDPDQRNNAGQTAAMYAALFGRVEVLKALAAEGADLRATDKDGNTPERLERGVFGPDVPSR